MEHCNKKMARTQQSEDSTEEDTDADETNEKQGEDKYYSWIGIPRELHGKLICQPTVGPFFDPKKPVKSPRKGESIGGSCLLI